MIEIKKIYTDIVEQTHPLHLQNPPRPPVAPEYFRHRVKSPRPLDEDLLECLFYFVSSAAQTRRPACRRHHTSQSGKAILPPGILRRDHPGSDVQNRTNS